MTIKATPIWRTLLAGALLLTLTNSSWAESRQATVRISCTVLPVAEFPSVDKKNLLEASKIPTNPNFMVQESFKRTFDGKMKTYSLTVL